MVRTSTFALNDATLPYIAALADKGWKLALADDKRLRDGLNVQDGAITRPAVGAGGPWPEPQDCGAGARCLKANVVS
ncbi:hypothetical protein [Acidocella aminolytica]|nr:hypothetical protein [Acidocella aminolytica]